MSKRSLPPGEGGAVKKRKLQGGLSLEQFASAKASGFDKKHERDKQRALNAKQVNALRQRLCLSQAATINYGSKACHTGGSELRLVVAHMWPMRSCMQACASLAMPMCTSRALGQSASAKHDAGEQIPQAQTEAAADGQADPQSPCQAPGEVLLVALHLPQACFSCSQQPGAGVTRHKRTALTA